MEQPLHPEHPGHPIVLALNLRCLAEQIADHSLNSVRALHRDGLHSMENAWKVGVDRWVPESALDPRGLARQQRAGERPDMMPDLLLAHDELIPKRPAGKLLVEPDSPPRVVVRRSCLGGHRFSLVDSPKAATEARAASEGRPVQAE